MCICFYSDIRPMCISFHSCVCSFSISFPYFALTWSSRCEVLLQIQHIMLKDITIKHIIPMILKKVEKSAAANWFLSLSACTSVGRTVCPETMIKLQGRSLTQVINKVVRMWIWWNMQRKMYLTIKLQKTYLFIFPPSIPKLAR